MLKQKNENEQAAKGGFDLQVANLHNSRVEHAERWRNLVYVRQVAIPHHRKAGVDHRRQIKRKMQSKKRKKTNASCACASTKKVYRYSSP